MEKRWRFPLITSTIDCQLSLEYNEPIRTQFRSYSLQILHLKFKFFLCINCLCNKICFRSLCCPLSVQNDHKLKSIHANIVQNPTFLERFHTFGGQCVSHNSDIGLEVLSLHLSSDLSLYLVIPARSHGNSHIFYEVANSYDLTRTISYDFCQIVRILRVAQFVRICRNDLHLTLNP